MVVATDLVTIENRACLPAADFQRWEQVLVAHSNIKRALDWMLAQQPALAPADIVGQDEFSFDILVPAGGLYLAYDTG
jgi:hypothetical protein